MNATMSRTAKWLLGLGAAALLSTVIAPRPTLRAATEPAPLLPEFTHRSASDWINSAPLTRGDLKGSVVLLDVWAFDCWNCYRSFPWLNEVAKRYADEGLKVIGVHAPEFRHERERDNVVAKVGEFGLDHPVMMDNDFSYWKALGNRYWPSFYLVDRGGRVRGVFIGETHAGDARARDIEAAIETLLAEEAAGAG
ncbi:MAG: redoxin family protein [Pseudomonadota bacterium]